MKKTYTLFSFLLFAIFVQAQTCPVQVTQQNVTCYGLCNGTATAFPSGGGPYTYQWTTTPTQTTATATGLCAGTYSIIVVNGSNCTAVNTVTITQPPQLVSNVSGTMNTSCTNCNGTLTVNTTGGTLPYTYSWTTSPSQSTATATGLCQGAYYVYITDANGCSTQNIGTVGNSTSSIQVVTTGNNPTSCLNCDGWVICNASGGTTPYTYLWSPSGCTTASCSNLCSGTYTVVVTDANGCTGTATWTLTAPGAPNFTTSVVPATQPNCNNGTATASVSNPGTYSYSWTTTPPQTTQTATGLTPGVYTVCVTNTGNGCSSCQAVTVNCLTGIEENNTNGNISVFPNPSTGIFMVETADMLNAKLEITNVMGSVVYKSEIKNDKTEINVSELSKGVYFLKVESDKGCDVKKIIIE